LNGHTLRFHPQTQSRNHIIRYNKQCHSSLRAKRQKGGETGKRKRNIILKNFNLLQNDYETGRIFSQPPLVSFKRNKNIWNFLVRSVLKSDEIIRCKDHLDKQQRGEAGSWCRSGSAMLNKTKNPIARLIGQLRRVILLPNISVRQNSRSSGAVKAK